MTAASFNCTPRHIVVLAHPDPGSFNAQIANVYCETVRGCGQEALLRDLHEMDFNPVLHADERPSRRVFKVYPDVQAELDTITGADVLTLVYPIWFGSPPAILKGYVDRVLGSGVTPRALQDEAGSGLLNGCRLVSFTSSAAREPWLAEVGQELSLRDVFDRYLQHAFGMKSSEHVQFGGVVEGFAKRFIDQYLNDVQDRARRVCAAVSAEKHKARAAAACARRASAQVPS
jgi:NAD(P)H dehydrogenase (quinone)